MEKDYEIISLGWNCQPRTYLMYHGLIATKKYGRKTMVFDLTGHTTKAIVELLKNHFVDYFDNFEYDFYPPFNINSWQVKKYDGILNHDNDIKPNEIEKLKERYERRISDFYKEVDSDKYLFFIHNIVPETTEEQINDLYNVLKNIREEKPFKLIIWDIFEKLDKSLLEKNIILIASHYSYDEFEDWFKPEKQDAKSKKWQEGLALSVADVIKQEGFKLKKYRIPFSKKFKNFIKPILKNTFSITKDFDMSAKVLIILGIKIKLKDLDNYRGYD